MKNLIRIAFTVFIFAAFLLSAGCTQNPAKENYFPESHMSPELVGKAENMISAYVELFDELSIDYMVISMTYDSRWKIAESSVFAGFNSPFEDVFLVGETSTMEMPDNFSCSIEKLSIKAQDGVFNVGVLGGSDCDDSEFIHAIDRLINVGLIMSYGKTTEYMMSANPNVWVI